MDRVLSLLLALGSMTVPALADALPVTQKASPDQQLGKQGSLVARANAHYLLATQLEADGRIREALSHYLSYLQHGSHENLDLLAHIIRLAESYQGLDSALAVLEKGIKDQPQSVEPILVYIKMAMAFAPDNQAVRERTEALVKESLKTFATRHEIYEIAVNYYLAIGQRETAQQVLRDAASQAKDDPEFWLALGRCAQEVWPIADTEHREAHLVNINPYFANASKAAFEKGDEAAALQVIDYYLFSNQMTQAIENCDALVKQTGSLDARKRQFRLYEAVERDAEALDALKELVKVHPEDTEHQRQLIGRYIDQQNWSQAIVHMESVIQISGGTLSDYLLISQLLRQVKDSEKVDRFTTRGTQLYPDDPRMSYERASALSDLKRYGEASSLFERVAKNAETTAPDLLDDGFYFSWGAALERSGKFDEAASNFDKSIQLTPPDRLERAAQTMNYLGYMWLEQNKNLDKAEQLIVKANELVRNNPAYIDSLGWLHYKKGRYDKALQELLRAVDLMEEVAPEDAEILEHVAQTYEKLDDKVKAREYWQKTLDLEPPHEDIRKRARQALGMDAPPVPKNIEASDAPERKVP